MVEKSVQFETETFREPVVSELTGEDWSARVRERLRAMSRLAPGWDTYDADPPNARALKLLDATIELLLAHGLCPRAMGPSVEGGGGYSFFSGTTRRFAEIEIDNDGDVSVTAMKIYPRDNDAQGWVFPHARREMVESIKIIRAFLGGEEIPKRSWSTNPAWTAEE